MQLYPHRYSAPQRYDFIRGYTSKNRRYRRKALSARAHSIYFRVRRLLRIPLRRSARSPYSPPRNRRTGRPNHSGKQRKTIPHSRLGHREWLHSHRFGSCPAALPGRGMGLLSRRAPYRRAKRIEFKCPGELCPSGHSSRLRLGASRRIARHHRQQPSLYTGMRTSCHERQRSGL